MTVVLAAETSGGFDRRDKDPDQLFGFVHERKALSFDTTSASTRTSSQYCVSSASSSAVVIFEMKSGRDFARHEPRGKRPREPENIDAELLRSLFQFIRSHGRSLSNRRASVILTICLANPLTGRKSAAVSAQHRAWSCPDADKALWKQIV